MTVPREGRRIDKDLFDEDARFGGVKTDDFDVSSGGNGHAASETLAMPCCVKTRPNAYVQATNAVDVPGEVFEVEWSTGGGRGRYCSVHGDLPSCFIDR